VTLPNKEVYSYRELRPEKINVVLFLHSTLSSSVLLDTGNLLNELESFLQEFRVIAPDFRGNGESSYLNPLNDLWELADDIKLFLDLNKIKQVVIIGSCLGGLVAKLISIKYPEYVKALILLGSVGVEGGSDIFADEQFFPNTKEDLVKTDYFKKIDGAISNKNMTIFEEIFTKKSDGSKGVLIHETFKTRNLKEVLWGELMTNLLPERNFYGVRGTAEIEKIKAPMLIIHGKEDKVTPFSQAVVLYNTLGSKQCKLVLLDNAGHFPWFDDLNSTITPLKEFF
jgi:pimeloyl-ACP methyl ester carboxylesterase